MFGCYLGLESQCRRKASGAHALIGLGPAPACTTSPSKRSVSSSIQWKSSVSRLSTMPLATIQTLSDSVNPLWLSTQHKSLDCEPVSVELGDRRKCGIDVRKNELSLHFLRHG